MDENSTLIVNYVFLSLLIGSFVIGIISLALDYLWFKPIIEYELNKIQTKRKPKPQKQQEEYSVIFDNDVYFK